MANIIHVGGGEKSGVAVQATQPDDTRVLWIDTSSGGIAKYYNGTAWVAMPAAFS